jgi:hypothetical protein
MWLQVAFASCCLAALFFVTAAAHGLTPRVLVYPAERGSKLSTLLNCTGDKDFINRHSSGQWGTDVRLHEWLTRSELRTNQPDEADFFFVPSYAKCLNDYGVLSIESIGVVFADVLDALPYFRCDPTGCTSFERAVACDAMFLDKPPTTKGIPSTINTGKQLGLQGMPFTPLMHRHRHSAPPTPNPMHHTPALRPQISNQPE